MASGKFECTYCGSILSCKSALTRHINSAQKCISQRGKDKKEKKEEPKKIAKKFICPKCDRALSSKQRLDGHISICKGEKKEISIEISDSSKNDFSKHDSSTHTTINGNVTINNMVPNNMYSSILTMQEDDILGKYQKYILLIL